ncbi:MAG TPA: hypothetical protein VKP88_08755 [Candidatus Paceibacterota bacterium]|nr:hypothetical protein [Candidatus Paceibacterota bacterium]
MPTTFTSRVDRYGNEYLSLAGLAQYPEEHPYWKQIRHWRRRPNVEELFPKNTATCLDWQASGVRAGWHFNAVTTTLIGYCVGEIDFIRSGNAQALYVNVNALSILSSQTQAGRYDTREELLRQFMLGELWAHDICYPNGPEELWLPECDPTDFPYLIQCAIDRMVPLHDYVLWHESTRDVYTKYCFHPVKRYFIGHVVE